MISHRLPCMMFWINEVFYARGQEGGREHLIDVAFMLGREGGREGREGREEEGGVVGHTPCLFGAESLPECDVRWHEIRGFHG